VLVESIGRQGIRVQVPGVAGEVVRRFTSMSCQQG